MILNVRGENLMMWIYCHWRLDMKYLYFYKALRLQRLFSCVGKPYSLKEDPLDPLSLEGRKNGI
jgi:hypothetical protein